VAQVIEHLLCKCKPEFKPQSYGGGEKKDHLLKKATSDTIVNGEQLKASLLSTAFQHSTKVLCNKTRKGNKKYKTQEGGNKIVFVCK
jgi:hypothetical protein